LQKLPGNSLAFHLVRLLQRHGIVERPGLIERYDLVHPGRTELLRFACAMSCAGIFGAVQPNIAIIWLTV